jgi:hypothetical protein
MTARPFSFRSFEPKESPHGGLFFVTKAWLRDERKEGSPTPRFFFFTITPEPLKTHQNVKLNPDKIHTSRTEVGPSKCAQTIDRGIVKPR